MLRSLYETVRRSLRLKIWMSMQLMTLGVLVLYLLSHFVIESRTTSRIVDQQVRLRAEELLHSTLHGMENLSDSANDHPLPMEKMPPDQLILHIADARNTIRYSNHADRIGSEIQVPSPQASPVTQGDSGRWYTQKSNGYFLLSAPLLNENRCQRCHSGDSGVLGSVQIGFPLGQVERLLWKSQGYHVVSGIVLLLLFSLLTLFLIRRLFIQRMGALASAIREIGHGNVSARIQDTSTDEIGLITQQFNLMLDEIARRRREEEDHHRQEINQFDRLATIGELVSGLAHEIRNPIAGIRAATQALSRRVPPTDPTYEVFQQICGNSDRLDALVRSLLSYARMEKPQMIPLQLNEIVEQSLLIFTNDSARDCLLHKKLSPDLPPVNGDPKLLQQVLLNILINARQARESGLELTLETCFISKQTDIHDTPEILQENPFRCQNGVIQVRISDNGPGIPPEDLRKIFRPFVTTKSHGTGLGLSISTRIMREHNGCLFVRNHSPHGATFVVCVPVISASTSVSAETDSFLREETEISRNEEQTRLYTIGQG